MQMQRRVDCSPQLRPAPRPEDQAQPRRRKDSDNTFAVIPRQEHYPEEDEHDDDDDDDDSNERDGHGHGHGDNGGTRNRSKTRYIHVEEQRPLRRMKVCPTGTLDVSRVGCPCIAGPPSALPEADVSTRPTGRAPENVHHPRSHL